MRDHLIGQILDGLQRIAGRRSHTIGNRAVRKVGIASAYKTQ